MWPPCGGSGTGFAFSEAGADITFDDTGFTVLRSIALPLAIGDRVKLDASAMADIVAAPTSVILRIMQGATELARMITDGGLATQQQGTLLWVFTAVAANPATPFTLEARTTALGTSATIGPAAANTYAVLTGENHGVLGARLYHDRKGVTMAVEQPSVIQAFCSVVYDAGVPVFQLNRGFRSVALMTAAPGPQPGMCILKSDQPNGFSQSECIFDVQAQSDLTGQVGFEGTAQWFVDGTGELCILVITTNCAGSAQAPFMVKVMRVNLWSGLLAAGEGAPPLLNSSSARGPYRPFPNQTSTMTLPHWLLRREL